ncbi:MAG TPA: DNA mismatch repair endonuclease MutL [Candidatus Dormibacteraeota bacterium]
MPRPELAAAGRIAILPPEVADGIAAGEVVDRPAAVVKELIENAIDAGSTRIAIRVEGAGQQLVEVADDGQGMAPGDLRLAFQRHATSKLRSLDDLGHLSTLGFRGEALASIAAVSRIEAVSRTADGGEGYRMVVEGGVTVVSRSAASPAGTRISVSRLFFNTPARLKFLKQPATETAMISRLVSEMALANPAIAVQLTVEGRRVLETTGSSDLRAAFAEVYDPELAAAMLAVEEPSVQGLLSPPALHRGTRDHVVLLVNHRRIQHRNLAFAIEQAYRGLRDPDRYPIAVLNLAIDPAEVDVNVHPTKREVRFRNEGAIFALLERACYRALRVSPIYEVRPATGGPMLELHETAVRSTTTPHPDLPPAAQGEGTSATASRLPVLTYVGQVLKGYLVAEAPQAMVLIDQHAAHERVLFDRLRQRLEVGRPESQLLLLPQVLDLLPGQLAAWGEHQAWIGQFGFEAEPFGPRTIRLLAIPADLPPARARRVFELLVADLAGERTPDRRLRETAALIACHSAVRFGDAMTPESARQLLSSLAETDEPISCPHGRPTTLMLADEHLRRLFQRP